MAGDGELTVDCRQQWWDNVWGMQDACLVCVMWMVGG